MAGSCQSRGLSISALQGHRCSLGSQKLVREEDLGKAGFQSLVQGYKARLVSKTKGQGGPEAGVYPVSTPPTFPLLVTVILIILPCRQAASVVVGGPGSLCLLPPPWPFWSILILFMQHGGQVFRDTVARVFRDTVASDAEAIRGRQRLGARRWHRSYVSHLQARPGWQNCSQEPVHPSLPV